MQENINYAMVFLIEKYWNLANTCLIVDNYYFHCTIALVLWSYIVGLEKKTGFPSAVNIIDPQQYNINYAILAIRSNDKLIK